MISKIVAAALAVLFACQLAFSQQPIQERQELVVVAKGGERHFQVELADEPEEQRTGLMFRRTMAPDEGMLFDFGTPREVTMWMRNTYLPLDMVFIGEDGRVRTIARRTTPLSERTISSKVPVRYVLELNAGVTDALGIAPGDEVRSPGIAAP